MATPMSAARFKKILEDAGLKVYTHGDWANHNRNHKGPWGPVHGVLIHHTVTRGHDSTIDICRKGYAALPGPLCQGVICKQGHVHLVGYGRANHAGLGDPDVLNAVKAESYATNPPADNQASTDGNRHFYGFECENMGDGKDPWPAVQLEAIEKASAAICDEHNWGEKSVIGHLEWQPGKVDPRGFTMASMRSRIKNRLEGNPGDNNEEEDMTPEQDKRLKELHSVLYPYAGWGYKGKNEKTDAYAYLRNTSNQVRTLSAQVTALTAAMNKILSMVGDDVDTKQVIEAVEKVVREELANAVVKVDVDVNGTEAGQ